MKVTAEVTIDNGTYEDWLKFFNSYESERKQFVSRQNSSPFANALVRLANIARVILKTEILTMFIAEIFISKTSF